MSDVLGKLIEGRGERDAIHMAIVPLVAGERLKPGTHFKVTGEKHRTSDGDTVFKAYAVKPCSHNASPATRRIVTSETQSDAIGVVDPFLAKPVEIGQQFYGCLYPGSITSLRHEWIHPAFAEKEPTDKDKALSEQWLRRYAVRIKPYEEDDRQGAFDRLCEGLRSDEVFAHGTDLHSFADLDDADELKFHAERYLGIRIDWDRFSFSCSC